jgi:hypothetical protein
MKKLFSVFTNDLEHCYFTGSSQVELHHIFYGNKNRKLSEKYGFIIPLRYDYHKFSNHSVHGNPNQGIDQYLKRMAQSYYETQIGSRKDFIREFGKSFL